MYSSQFVESMSSPIASKTSMSDYLLTKEESIISPNPDGDPARSPQLQLHLNCLAVKSNSLEASIERASGDAQILIVHVETSAEQFQTATSNVIAKINEHAASTIAAVRELCHDRVKLLDAQADELTVTTGQIKVCKEEGHAAIVRGHPASVRNRLREALVVKKLCRMNLHPRVSTQLDIRTNSACNIVRDLESMSVLKNYDVDAKETTACGPGLVSSWRGEGGVNDVTVLCRDNAGNPIEWVTDMDVLVMVKSNDGKEVGRGVGVQVFEKGRIMIQYEVDDVDVEEVVVSVFVADVLVCGSPLLVGVLRSIINPDAVHINKHCIDGSADNFSDVVTLDGIHAVVSCYFSHCILVYNMETDGCMLTFGSYGTGPGQFSFPAKICATPTVTLLVSEHGNERIQEVTMTGDHVRFIGQHHLKNNRIWGMCLQNEDDMLAVGLLDGFADDRIVLFNYSSGALIRKFGSGELKSVRGLCFTPDGTHILAVGNSRSVSFFSVDGAFVKAIGTDVLGSRVSDVLCSGSSIFVVDLSNHRVCVFSSETDALIRTLDIQDLADRELMYPTALTTYRNQLLVLDCTNVIVHVFK